MQKSGQVISNYNFRRSTRKSQKTLNQMKRQCKIPNQLKNQVFIPQHLREQIQKIDFLSQKSLNEISYRNESSICQGTLSFQDNLKMMHIAAQRQEQNYKSLISQKNIPNRNIKNSKANQRKAKAGTSQTTISPSQKAGILNAMEDENFTLEKQEMIDQLHSIHLQNSMDLFNGQDADFFGNRNFRGQGDYDGILFLNHREDQKNFIEMMETEVDPIQNIAVSNFYDDARDFEGFF